MEVSGQLHAPPTLFPGDEGARPLHRGVGGPQSRPRHFGEERHVFLLPKFELLTVQPVGSPYTNYAIRCVFNAVYHVQRLCVGRRCARCLHVKLQDSASGPGEMGDMVRIRV
jgi:hypothetical protein